LRSDGVRFVCLIGVRSGRFDSPLALRSIFRMSIPPLLPDSLPSFSSVDEAMVRSTTRRESVLRLFLAVLSSSSLLSDAAEVERLRTRERDARRALAKNLNNGQNLVYLKSRCAGTLLTESSMFVKS